MTKIKYPKIPRNSSRIHQLVSLFKKQNKTNNDIEKKAFTMDDFVMKKKKKSDTEEGEKDKGGESSDSDNEA